MKKNLFKVLIFILPFIFMKNVYAASATIGVSSSANQVIVGKNVTVYVTVSSSSALGSWEYTLNYDNSVFKLVSSDVELHYASYASNDKTKSVTYKYNFTALKSGKGKFYIDSSGVVGWDEKMMNVSDGSKTVGAITYAEYQASLSSNNNLSSLSIEGYELTPEFNKDTLEYDAKVSENETKIKINAITEDKRASITGDGEIDVTPGNNNVVITVIAENGAEKTYKINIEVIDKNPIYVTVDSTEYTIVKLASNLTKPESFVETTATIDGFEIPAFYNEVLSFTLVGLKDGAGNVSLFIYENGKYYRYIELTSGNITIYPKDISIELKDYQKGKCVIQNHKIDCLSLNNDNRYKVINGINVETNEEGLYLYDTKDNTFIKYDHSHIDTLYDKLKMITYVALLFGTTTLISLVTVIIVLSKNGKNKKNKPETILDEDKPTKVKVKNIEKPKKKNNKKDHPEIKE